MNWGENGIDVAKSFHPLPLYRGSPVRLCVIACTKFEVAESEQKSALRPLVVGQDDTLRILSVMRRWRRIRMMRIILYVFGGWYFKIFQDISIRRLRGEGVGRGAVGHAVKEDRAPQ